LNPLMIRALVDGAFMALEVLQEVKDGEKATPEELAQLRDAIVERTKLAVAGSRARFAVAATEALARQAVHLDAPQTEG
jgi:hypothetical protein